MPYATQRDRPITNLEISRAPWPAPPLNLFLTSGYEAWIFDLVWDDPSQLSRNGDFILLGVNVYRSFDSEFGPFQRLTNLPVGSTYWRDRTDIELIVEEDVSANFVLKGQASVSHDLRRYVFKTLHYPIVKSGSQGTNADSPEDVYVYVDGVQAVVKAVRGFVGEVEIDGSVQADVATQKAVLPVYPKEDSQVLCSYRRVRSLLRTDLSQRVFYRVTTVGILASDSTGKVVETPLENAISTSSFEIEKLDYIWREAVHRNRWILEQGGERVKVFLRKNVGLPCPCIEDDFHNQPINDCIICFGTGIVDGYEGPYDIIIAPDDAERKISQKDIGRTIEHTYEAWTGPSPLLAHRDFLVKVNGERYSIGAVRMPTNRGMILQQHFNIGHFDEKDIRYKVPMDGPRRYPAAGFIPSGPEDEAEAIPTDHPDVPAEVQLRGRSLAWENTEY
jgi:hypothetical protein